MSNEDLVKRLREDRSVKTDRLEAADYIEHCHASHDAMAAEIERLTRERDEAREDASVARQSLYEVCEQRNSAMAINAAPSAFDLKVMAERDAAERKVEKLWEALSFVGNIAHAEGDTAGICDIVRAALAETEKGDE